MARAPVSKTGGSGFESLHSCQVGQKSAIYRHFLSSWHFALLFVGTSVHRSAFAAGKARSVRAMPSVAIRDLLAAATYVLISR